MNLGNTVRQWQMRWAQVRELEALGREQREALARDIGIPPEMLPALWPAAPTPPPNFRASCRLCPSMPTRSGRSTRR